MKLPLIGLALVSATSVFQAQAACYTVYMGSNIVYRSTTAPVDTSRPYSESVPERFGSGASMVTTSDETGCSQVSLSRGTPPEGISSASRSRDARGGRPGVAPNQAPTRNGPVSLDDVFRDQSLQMRSSVGVSPGAVPGTTVQRRP